jgi:hypothetical protein
MKRYLLAAAMLGVILSGCFRPPVDVLFNSDPRILRGTWTGTLEKYCNSAARYAAFSQDNAKVYLEAGKTRLVVDVATGAILTELLIPTRGSPVVWNTTATTFKYVFNDVSNNSFIAEINAQNGQIISSVALPKAMSGNFSGYSPDLKLAARVGNSQINVFNLETKTPLKTIPTTGDTAYLLGLTQTHLVYAISQASLRLHRLDTGAEQTIEAINPYGFHLGATHLYAWTTGTPKMLRKISLNDSSVSNLPVPYAENPTFSSDGTQVAYVANDTLFVHSLADGSVLGQASLNTQPNPLGAAGVVAAGSAGRYLAPATSPACGVRSFVVGAGFVSATTLETPSNDPITFSFTPKFETAYWYSFTGTLKIGSAAPQNITGQVNVPQYCNLYSSSYGACEQLKPATSPPMPFGNSQLKNAHNFELRDEQGQPILGSLGSLDSLLFVGNAVQDNSIQLLSGDLQYQILYKLKATPVTP